MTERGRESEDVCTLPCLAAALAKAVITSLFFLLTPD